MAFMQILEFGSSFIEILMGIYFITSSLSNERIKVKNNIVGAIVGAAIIWSLNQISLFSVYISIVAIMLIPAITCMNYHLRLQDAILVSAFYMILLYIVDFFVLSVIGIVIGEDKIIGIIVSGMTWKRAALICMSKATLAFVSWFLVAKILVNISILVRKLWIALIVFGAAVAYFVKSSFVEVTVDILWTWFFILLFFILAIYTIVQYLRYAEDREKMNLALERNRIQLDAYNEVIQTYQARQIFFHDLKNQYIVLEKYLKEKKYEEAERYIGELRMERYKSQQMQYTGIIPVDILLEYKAKEAEKKNIRIHIVADKTDIPLSDQEAISLLGNAFDNAIEACEKIEDGDRWIRIDIQRRGAMIFIKIANSYKNQPIDRAEVFFTTKEHSQTHGLGIMSMKMIVDKYDGAMDVTAKNGEVAIAISFFC